MSRNITVIFTSRPLTFPLPSRSPSAAQETKPGGLAAVDIRIRQFTAAEYVSLSKPLRGFGNHRQPLKLKHSLQFFRQMTGYVPNPSFSAVRSLNHTTLVPLPPFPSFISFFPPNLRIENRNRIGTHPLIN